jgi:transposase
LGLESPGYKGGLVGRHSLSVPKTSKGGGTVHDLFVGIDVSKNSSSAKGLDKKGRKSFYLSFKMDSDGFSELLKAITSQSKDLSKVIVALESTACYHINLFSFLTSKGIDAVVINPLLISNFAKLSLRKTKTDRKDAMTIARFLLVNKDSITKLSVSQDIQDLRDIARERESLCHLISANKTEIKRVLQTTFPELESVCNIYTKSMLNFIAEFPSARLVRTARSRTIAKALRQPGRGNKISFPPEAIINAAKTSVATFSPAKEFILPGKISTLIHLEKRRDELTRALTEYCKSAMVENLKIITSIDGINTGTATTFLAEMGDVASYGSHKNLIAFAGIDPTVYQSGKFEGASRISKRGNRHLRRVIWLMTVNVIHFNAIFKEYGLPFKKAVFATAHKLIRVIFAMLSQRTYFRENCL